MTADWRPNVSLVVLRERAAMLQKIRIFFAERDVLEVETPILGSAFGTDPGIEPLITKYAGEGVSGRLTCFLQSSPEFYMKRLLAAGSGSIYQVCKAFRNGETGRRHRPEFTLLEWYRVGFALTGLMAEVADLMRQLLQKPELTLSHHRYADLFADQLQLDVLDATVGELRQCALKHNLYGVENLSLDRDAWLDLLMSHCIEPGLKVNQLCFITDYPASQAALAKINPYDPRIAERFELYYQGMELANGFAELGDAVEQAARFERENCQRRSNAQRPMPVDVNLLAALEHGLPDCSGVALGLDRLLMAKLGIRDIARVLI